MMGLPVASTDAIQPDRLKQLAPCFFQNALLEFLMSAKEFLIGTRQEPIHVARFSEFDGTEIVGSLGKSVCLHVGGLIGDGVLRQRVVDCTMKRGGDRSLASVVVDLHLVETLVEPKAIEKVVHQVPSQSFREPTSCVVLRCLVDEWLVGDRKMAKEDTEAREESGSCFCGEAGVCAVTVEKIDRVEGYVWQPLSSECRLISLNTFGDRKSLVVRDNHYDVKGGIEAFATGLVNEQAEFLHRDSPKNKKAGENVPGTWKPSHAAKTFFFIGVRSARVKDVRRTRSVRRAA